jgi:hypothetical protein
MEKDKGRNPLFVDSKDSFSAIVYYSVDEDNGILLAAREDQLTEDEKKDMSTIEFSCIFPDWGTCRTIVSESTVNVGGRIFVDPGQMQVALINHLVVGWDIEKDDGKPLKFSMEKLINLRPDIVRCLIELVNQELVAAGIWESLVQI